MSEQLPRYEHDPPSTAGDYEPLLTADEINKLATYNTQVAQGLVHTEEFKAEMAELQDRFARRREYNLPARKRWWER